MCLLSAMLLRISGEGWIVIGLAFTHLIKCWVSLSLPSSEGIMQAVSLWKNTCINVERQSKNKTKELFCPPSEPNVLLLLLRRYRRIVSNNCTDGLREKYMAKMEKCPGKAPRGLHILTSDGKLVMEQGHNATFLILMEEVCSLTSQQTSQQTSLCVAELAFFSFTFQVAERKIAVKGDHEMVNGPEIYEN